MPLIKAASSLNLMAEALIAPRLNDQTLGNTLISKSKAASIWADDLTVLPIFVLLLSFRQEREVIFNT